MIIWAKQIASLPDGTILQTGGVRDKRSRPAVIPLSHCLRLASTQYLLRYWWLHLLFLAISLSASNHLKTDKTERKHGGMEPLSKTGGWGYGGVWIVGNWWGCGDLSLTTWLNRRKPAPANFLKFRCVILMYHLSAKTTGLPAWSSSPKCGASAAVKARYRF